MRIIFSLLIMSSLPFFMTKKEKATQPKEKETIQEYCNTRYHFCLKYPEAALPKSFISDNGDGIILHSDAADVVITVSGSRSVMGRDTRELYNVFVKNPLATNPEAQIKYEIIEKPYYEVFYTEGDHQFYQKLFHQGNKYLIYQIVAPKGEDFLINNIREKIQLSFDI